MSGTDSSHKHGQLATVVDGVVVPAYSSSDHAQLDGTQRFRSVAGLFTCLSVVTVAFSIAGLAITFPAAELAYKIEAVAPPKKILPTIPAETLDDHLHDNTGTTSAQAHLSALSVPAETHISTSAALITPTAEPLADRDSVPIGASLEYEVLFTDQFPVKDISILCKNLPRQRNIALASRQCGVLCAQDKGCRYFWATVDGRCCLKAAYDTTSAARTVPGKNSGQFSRLTARGPDAAASMVGMQPPQVQKQQQSEATVESQPPNVAPTLLGTKPQVAVIILGQMRSFLTPKVQQSQRFLVRPLQDQFGADNVHLYLCADPGHRKQLESVRIAGATPTVFEARSRTMFAHMSTCYQKTIDHAASMQPPLVINWFVRSRFDSVFFENVPPLLNLAEDTVYARARRIGHGWKNVDNEQISYWMWGDVCGDRAGDFQCMYRDTKEVDATGKCMIMDDQFAYVPAAYATVGPTIY
eukprot:COSAG02_NODE_223_length_28346_cov_91.381846_1_plen_470_part_00